MIVPEYKIALLGSLGVGKSGEDLLSFIDSNFIRRSLPDLASPIPKEQCAYACLAVVFVCEIYIFIVNNFACNRIVL